MSMQTIAAICCGVLAVAAAILGAPAILAGRSARVRIADAELARRAADYALTGAADDAAGTLADRLGPLSARLKEAGIDAPAPSWLALRALLAAMAACACVAFGLPAWTAAVAIIVVAAICMVRVEASRASRTARFERQLSEALPMMAENLRSGQSPAKSLLTVAQYMENPLNEEFSRAAREMGYGVPFTVAMDAMFSRVPCEDLRLVNGVIAINAESGGNLSDILDSIATTMQMRAQMRGHIRSITASGRMSAIIVASLPWVMIAGLWLTSPEYLQPLVDAGLLGAAIIAVVAVMDVVGFLVIRSMYTIEVE